MSENIQSIANGSFVLGNTNELTFSAGPGISITQPSEGTVRIGTDSNDWIDVRNEVSYNTNLIAAGGFNIYYNKFLKLVVMSCDVNVKAGSEGINFMSWTNRLKPVIKNFSLGAGLNLWVGEYNLNQHAGAAQRWLGGTWCWPVEGE